uniref:Uncharacterized protein n=1 Tax=Magallana gigas TaxID=29159 RepID=A0A8W8J443_MAGGI
MFYVRSYRKSENIDFDCNTKLSGFSSTTEERESIKVETSRNNRATSASESPDRVNISRDPIVCSRHQRDPGSSASARSSTIVTSVSLQET